MNQQEWNDMSNAQRLEYLESHTVKVTGQTGLLANVSVREIGADSFVYRYQATRGGLVTSGWHDTEEAALKEDAETMQYWREKAE